MDELEVSIVNSHSNVYCRMRKILLVCWIIAELTGISARAAGLKPETAAAFDRYIRAVEARMEDDVRLDQFLVVDRLADSRRLKAYDQLQKDQIYIEEQHIREEDRPIHIPSGLIHHWAGIVFIPKATLLEVVAVLHDYDHHQDIFKPDIRQSKLIEQNEDESRIYFQFFNKSIVTAVLNANFDVADTQFGSTRLQIACRSTRIAEVADEGKPNEHERPVGDDHGYMWRLYTYWRIEEKDGGVYVQNESVSLSRTVPPIIALLVNPLVKSIPRDILLHLMTDTRNAVMKAGTASGQEGFREDATESLPVHDGSGSTDDRPCVVWATWGAKGRSSPTALRSATDQTAPSALLRRC